MEHIHTYYHIIVPNYCGLEKKKQEKYARYDYIYNLYY